MKRVNYKIVNEKIKIMDVVQRIGEKTVKIGDVPKALVDDTARICSNLSVEATREDLIAASNKMKRENAKVRILSNPNINGSAGYIAIGTLTVVLTLIISIGIFVIVGKVLGY